MSYHWTTRANALQIEKEGIKINSFFCQKPWHWDGEVCFHVDVAMDWNNPDKDWQRVNFDSAISPKDIRRLNWLELNIAKLLVCLR